MYYVISAIGCICVIAIYIVCKASSDISYEESVKQESIIWKYEKKMDKLKGLADEQNWSIQNMTAGRYEEAFAGFENVKDEIERMYNEKELNTADNDNV